jgi:hypothetical protein
MTFEKILPQLIKLTADVGKVIMSFYKADMAVEMKLNKTPLTIRYISERTISLNTKKG